MAPDSLIFQTPSSHRFPRFVDCIAITFDNDSLSQLKLSTTLLSGGETRFSFVKVSANFSATSIANFEPLHDLVAQPAECRV